LAASTFLVSSAAANALSGEALDRTNSRPNIIYVLADDLGYGDLGCYGQRVIRTPHIDRMAKEGMRFTRHYAGSTVCAPSRSSLLEGKHTGHTYIRGNLRVQKREDPQDVIFPQALRQVGYHTAMIGKSGVACVSDDAGLPFRKGFDYFFGFTSHVDAHWYFPPYLWRNNEGIVTKLEYPGNTRHEGYQFSSELVMEEALAYVEKHREGPFFLHLAFQLPHASLRAPEEWKAQYRALLDEEPLPQQEHRHYSYEREPKTTYAAMVSYMDHNMGRLLARLRELGIAERTLVIFASDNGAMQEGGHLRESFNSSGPLRGGKRDLYEGGLRTPMIAWWPGTVAAGSQSDHRSAFWDISPTLRELAGAEPQADTDGISILPTLLGRGTQPQHDYLYWEFYEDGGKRAVLKGDWKLIQHGIVAGGELREELFNLANDQGEADNRAEEHPERATELRALMDKAHVPGELPQFRLAR
jgi:arylsulfatase A-like enzyme